MAMELRRLGERDIPVVAGWMADPDNHRWLRLGPRGPAATAAALREMIRADAHLLRVFPAERGGPCVGVVGLSDIDHGFRSATLWYVLGDRPSRGRGLTSRAVRALLSEAFEHRGLFAINAWVVDGNLPSIRVLENNHFRYVGRQRLCHYLDGRPCDRLLYDLLAPEHRDHRSHGQ